jgi:hypothetical protein
VATIDFPITALLDDSLDALLERVLQAKTLADMGL